jgi:RNA polymerase sigma factor (sigma-70 family)
MSVLADPLMALPTDTQLLAVFCRDRDEQAFAVLVERHYAMVHAAAARQLHASAHAQDVAQAVFMLLARKAARVRGETLSGWLIATTRLVALEFKRSERRRHRREQQAAASRPEHVMIPTDAGPAGAEQSATITAILDQGLARLDERDRTAVTLHYLQGRSMNEVAGMVGITPAAAQKRTQRAIARLRRFFAGRGIEATTEAVGGALLLCAAQETASPATANAVAANALAWAAGHSIDNSAAALASSVARAADWRWALLAAAMSIALLCAASTYAYQHRHAPAEAAAARVAVRVGVLLSQSCGDNSSDPYKGQFRLVAELRDPLITLVPLIDRSTENDPQLIPLLAAKELAGQKPIDDCDPLALQGVDVIVANQANVGGKVFEAIERAVENGTGLVMRQACPPDFIFDQQVLRICGLVQGQYAYKPYEELRAQVVGEHPLLGRLSGKKSIVLLKPNGPYGVLAKGAQPLLRLVQDEHVKLEPVGPQMATYADRADVTFDPLYVYTIGKGRVVMCAFAGFKPISLELDAANGGKFMIRAARWAANKPLE